MNCEPTRYEDWAPTQFDHKGLSCDSQQDWYVAPVVITRDTPQGIETANFESIEEALDEAKVKYETRSFNHWGPGWFRIILVHPDGATLLTELTCALLDYPILDESKVSEHEYEEECSAWDNYYAREFREELAHAFEAQENFSDAILVDELDDDQLLELLQVGMDRSNTYWEHESTGACLQLNRVVEEVGTRDLDSFRSCLLERLHLLYTTERW